MASRQLIKDRPDGEVTDPLVGPITDAPQGVGLSRPQRLARHRIHLDDGHPVGITMAGSGIPLVVIHGFTAEGFLYAQTLSRLCGMGFRVIAIDIAGHGGTAGLPEDGANIAAYSALVKRVLDELGIRHALLAGHSMGGRLVTQLAANHPERVLGVVLIDAIVGDTWDRMVYLFRVWPPLLGAVGVALMVDSILVPPLSRDPRQAVKFLRLFTPTLLGHVAKPWRLLGPAVSILRTRSSRYALDAAAAEGVPFYILHGDRDVAVPHRTSEDAARRVGADLITVEKAGHSWLLSDPETLPAIMAELLEGRLGDDLRAAFVELGVGEDPDLPAIHSACYEPGAAVFDLALPEPQEYTDTAVKRAGPAFAWHRHVPDVTAA
jgi:pimeloyl-ACP methyl ester carboxylesterase